MSDDRHWFSDLSDKINRAVHSQRGKNVLLYMMCLCVAFVFWVLMSLDTEVQRDFDVPVELYGIPDSITLITDMPRTIETSVQGKGSQLIRFRWGKMSPLKLRFDPSLKGKNSFVLSKTQLDSRIRDYFGSGVQVMSIRPDSIRLSYTSEPGRRLPLSVVADVHPNLQYVISGPISASVDSVTVYSTGDIPRDLTHIDTEPLVKWDLRDTLRATVRVKPIPGLRVIPDQIVLTVPVEQLILKPRTVRVEVINMPQGMTMLTFPGQVEVSYLVPMSKFSGDDYPVKVYADYNDIKSATNGKIPLHPGATPAYYQNFSVKPDSVEYVLEHID